MEIKKIDYDFSVCKVEDYTLAKLDSEYCFIGKTDEENLGFTYAEITYGNLSCEAKVNVVCYPVVNAPRLLAHTKDTKFKLQSEQYVVGDDNQFYFLRTIFLSNFHFEIILF